MTAVVCFYEHLPQMDGPVKFIESVDGEYFRIGYRNAKGEKISVRIRDADWPVIAERHHVALLEKLARLASSL